ncbi:hypothetical protein BKA65DRAFT_30198 [Rhexocercosporidium sp. MPI-PUGE-AT-0058]|nr:hypothetical protein BKA65DRAFT_30198 [Rhexocercosporidium sp. MPI-PUGE-AT-0058]
MPRLPPSPKAVVPTILSILSFALVVVLMAVGSSPDWQSFALISIDTTTQKNAFYTGTGSGLPIHDAYSLHLQTVCESYLMKASEAKFAGVVCDEPSTYVKFLPLTLIQNDLTTHRSSQTIGSLRIPGEIQDVFTKKYNLILHVAYILYVFAITSAGIGVLLGGAKMFNVFENAALVGLGNAVLSTLLLFVASTMATAIQANSTSLINALGPPIGIFAFHGSGFMILTWCSCVSSLLATGAWLMVNK